MKTDNAGWSSTMQAKNCEIFVRNPLRIHPFDMAKTEAAIIVRIARDNRAGSIQTLQNGKPVPHQP